jgi:glycosyltransferase involved in cell wall biosynthesis
MRILHVIPSLDPATGGPPMIAARLAAGQASLGHDVRMLCHDDPARREPVQRALEAVPFFDRVRVVALPSPTRWERWAGPSDRATVRQAIAEVEAVHLHSIWEAILRIAAVEARRAGKPYYILLNGMLDPWSLQQSALKKRIAMWMGYRRMFNGAAGLHLGNEDEKQLIAPLGLTPPGHIIPNGVFLEELDPLPAAGSFYANHPQLDGKPYVLFLSRLHYKKGPDVLADAFVIAAQTNDDVQLVVAGPDGGARAAFESQVRDLGIADRVHVVGPIYGNDKLAALRDALCFCLPSHQEGFSMAITEALGCGTAVVISEGCHFPQVATAGAGMVLPRDAKRFGEALIELINDPGRAKAMGDAGRKLVESHYTWPKIAQQTVKMYQKHVSAD